MAESIAADVRPLQLLTFRTRVICYVCKEQRRLLPLIIFLEVWKSYQEKTLLASQVQGPRPERMVAIHEKPRFCGGRAGLFS